MSVEDAIRHKLNRALAPLELEIHNESHKHKGHAGDTGTGESHFRVKIVSDMFIGKSRLDRQRLIYDLLKDEMSRGAIHALALKALSPKERG